MNLKTLCCALLISAPLLAVAEDTSQPQYKVELVIFEATNPSAQDSERWPEESALPQFDKLKNLTEFNTGAGPKLLNPADLQLKGIYASLEKSKNHHPLLHLGWTQTIAPGETGTTLHVYSGLEASDPSTPSAMTPFIDGIVTLSRKTYLHINTDLVYAHDSAQGTPKYRLQTSRRLRSDEIHYFDHPMFGMILAIKEVKPTTGGKK